MQAKDAIVPAGRRIGLMVLLAATASTRSARPRAREVTLDLAGSSFTLPVVGGSKRAGDRVRRRPEDGSAGRRTVPATLSLTLGAPAHVRRVHAGRGARVHGVHDGDRDLHRG